MMKKEYLILPNEAASSSSKIRLYPNPVKNQLNIDLPEVYIGQPLSLDMFNLDGKGVKQFRAMIDGSSPELNVSDLINGVYYCQIQIGGKVEVTLKVVVLH